MPTEPSWWYDSEPRLVTTLLRPAAALYGHLVQRRMSRSTSYVSRLPVVCVGNFTAGGTGKTPLTRALVTHLTDAGGRPAILSRGYGGSQREPHWVDRARDAATRVGDEPLLLARDAPVMVASDRVAGARAIETDPRRFTHIVMDDGLQNPALQKSLVIAVLDGARGVGNGQVLPAGPLRAPLAFQHTLVDAIVINAGGGTGRTPADQTTVATAVAGFGGPVMMASIEADATAVRALTGRPLLAFAGIGVPDKFFSMLRDLGLDLKTARAFPDHHVFTAEDASDLWSTARVGGLTLVTTEKDGVRLNAQAGPLADLAAATAILPIRMTLPATDMQHLVTLLAARTNTMHTR